MHSIWIPAYGVAAARAQRRRPSRE